MTVDEPADEYLSRECAQRTADIVARHRSFRARSRGFFLSPATLFSHQEGPRCCSLSEHNRRSAFCLSPSNELCPTCVCTLWFRWADEIRFNGRCETWILMVARYVLSSTCDWWKFRLELRKKVEKSNRNRRVTGGRCAVRIFN